MLLFACFAQSLLTALCSCVKDEYEELTTDSLQTATDNGANNGGNARNRQNGISYSVWKTGTNMVNKLTFENANRSCQGTAIKDSIMFRLYNTGICQTFDISNIYAPLPLHVFKLGAFRSNNHCNCAQFRTDNETTLLYVSGLYGKCYVENISEAASSLIQTITVSNLSFLNNCKHYNLIPGDDAILWLLGGDSNTLYFAALRRPELDEGNVTLTDEDVYDWWVELGYNYNESVWQGGMVHEGKLYFVFGTTTSRSHLAIYDTYTHALITDIPLDDYVSEEPEDIDLLGDKIILTVNGGSGYYIISDDQASGITLVTM